MSAYFTNDEKEVAQAVFNERGIDGLREYLEVKLDEWKTIPLNVGVIGNSGCGKSSFINTVRGLTADDEGAAAVGSTETTMVPTPYPHPDNSLVKYWDLPGVGTPNFPRETYLEAIGFEKYDFFLILSSVRFTQDDAWIGKKIVKKSKKFYFIRTKIRNDVDGDKRAHPKRHDAEKLIQKIRENIQSNLKEMGVDVPIFLIDNYEPLEYDFNRLGPKLVEDLPQRKKEVMIRNMHLFSADVVKKKIELLRSEAKILSIAISITVSVPILGSVIAARDKYGVLGEIESYVMMMGLNDASLKRLAATCGVSFTALREAADEHFAVDILNDVMAFEEFINKISNYKIKSIAEFSLSVLPIIGSIPAAIVSHKKILGAVGWIIDQIEKASLAVIEKALAGDSE